MLLLFISSLVLAQTDPNKEKALDLLHKSFGGLGEKENYAIHFEAIASGLQEPKDIFKLPVYKIYKGGHLYCDGNKFEISTSGVKALCDGKLVVAINEMAKSMVIDSLRRPKNEDSQKEIDIAKRFGHDFDDMTIKYQGTEKINGKQCHKIYVYLPDNPKYHVFYWIEVSTEKLYLMAEWQEKSYEVYWIRKIGKAPSNYVYNVNVPKKEIDKLYGYEVFDMRFITSDVKGKKY